jgi:hypothetical protein
VRTAGHSGEGRALGEDAAHGFLHGSKDLVAPAEADLPFGRVDVDVHLGGVQVHVEDDDGIASCGQQGMVGFASSITEGAVLHPAAVDKEDQVPAIRAVQ